MFLQRLNEITRPKVIEATVDLGLGDGPETLYFRKLAYEDRQIIFAARTNADGSMDVREKGLMLAAEFVAKTLCDANGKAVANTDAVRQWDSDIVEKLAAEAMRVLMPGKEDASVPSTGQS